MLITERFLAKVDKSGECWEWTARLNNGGYGQIRLGGRFILAHRYSFILHHPITIDLLQHREICVCHRCDNRKCVNPEHLFLGSMKDNNDDKMAKGRWGGGDKKGEKQAQHKLTETQVREIRGRWEEGGITQRKLSVEYGVYYTTISKIISRKTWGHLE